VNRWRFRARSAWLDGGSRRRRRFSACAATQAVDLDERGLEVAVAQTGVINVR
jgi:hypothetical protein